MFGSFYPLQILFSNFVKLSEKILKTNLDILIMQKNALSVHILKKKSSSLLMRYNSSGIIYFQTYGNTVFSSRVGTPLFWGNHSEMFMRDYGGEGRGLAFVMTRWNKWNSFRASPVVLLKIIICFLWQVFHQFILMWKFVKTFIFLENCWFKIS